MMDFSRSRGIGLILNICIEVINVLEIRFCLPEIEWNNNADRMVI